MRNDGIRYNPSSFRPYKSRSFFSTATIVDQVPAEKSSDFEVHSASALGFKSCPQTSPTSVVGDLPTVPHDELSLALPSVDRKWKPVSPSPPVQTLASPFAPRTNENVLQVGVSGAALGDESHRPDDPVARYLDLQIGLICD